METQKYTRLDHYRDTGDFARHREQSAAERARDLLGSAADRIAEGRYDEAWEYLGGAMRGLRDAEGHSAEARAYAMLAEAGEVIG